MFLRHFFLPRLLRFLAIYFGSVVNEVSISVMETDTFDFTSQLILSHFLVPMN